MSSPHRGLGWSETILGYATNALCLRELVNQNNLATGGTTTVFDVEPYLQPEDYSLFEERVLKCVPVFPSGVVQNAKQWSLAARRKKTLVIKAGNQLALPWLLEMHHSRAVWPSDCPIPLRFGRGMAPLNPSGIRMRQLPQGAHRYAEIAPLIR